MPLTASVPMPSLQPALRGFEHIKRSWDGKIAKPLARLLPGEFYVTRYDEAIYTTLGSCVAACIRDPATGVGGMNHFMLPLTPAMAEEHEWGSDAAMYGNYAMEHLINEIMKNGGKRHNLEVKIFGGGKILQGMSDIGEKNIAFVRQYLHTESLPVVAEDVGTVYPRVVIYFPGNGDVLVKRIRSLHANLILEQEQRYSEAIRPPAPSSVDFF